MYDILWLLNFDALVCQLENTFFVLGQGEALEESRAFLPLEFADTPLLGLAFLGIETDFQRVV